MSVESREPQSGYKEPVCQRKPYNSPVLTVYGPASAITQRVARGATDFYGGSNVVSDSNLKEGFAAVDPQDILTRLVSIPVKTWSYHFQDPSIRHIGPMAQDFAAVFGVGEDNRLINMVDANGVAMAAIQALYGLIQARDLQIDGLRNELEQLKRQLAPG